MLSYAKQKMPLGGESPKGLQFGTDYFVVCGAEIDVGFVNTGLLSV